MKTPRQRLFSLLCLHRGKCAVRECTDLAIAAYEMERQGYVSVTPQVESSTTSYKMIVVTRIRRL